MNPAPPTTNDRMNGGSDHSSHGTEPQRGPGWATAFILGLREAFSLSEARARVERYEPATLADIRARKRDAASRLRASRRLAQPRLAIDLLIAARELAADAVAFAGRARPTFEPIDAAVFAFGEAETVRDALELEVAALLASVESRTTTELSGLVYGRFAAIVVALCAVLYVATSPWRVHDVALGKPVTTSPLLAPPDKPDGIVDGRTRGTFGLQTNKGRSVFVMIDLERTYRIRRIAIYNRGDGWFDEILPLTLEVSSDGFVFQHVATRTEHFQVWDLRFDHGLDARYVRVSKTDGYIALNEIEVYARD